eukprot:jgi/Hompol1/4113/HPOL_006930-RA
MDRTSAEIQRLLSERKTVVDECEQLRLEYGSMLQKTQEQESQLKKDVQRLEQEVEAYRTSHKSVRDELNKCREEHGARVRMLESEVEAIKEQHAKENEHKASQWSAIVKHKEMEFQNALRQKDNQISQLKAATEQAENMLYSTIWIWILSYMILESLLPSRD